MDFWIGLSARGLDSSLTWSDGTPLDFVCWEDDFNATQSIDSCIVFDKQRGSWSIDHCNRFLGVICKRGLNASYDFVTPEPTSTLPGNCQKGWYRLGNKCYWIDGKRYSKRVSWNEALQKCQKEGATLASIHSEEEQEFLTDILLEVGSSTWIGLENVQKDNVFKWKDDTPLDYTNWNVNEPSVGMTDMSSPRSTSNSNLCVELDSSVSEIGKWNDIPCFRTNSFICQKNVDPAITELSEDLFACPNISSWKKLGSSCYGVFDEENQKLPWLAAQTQCRTHGANLIVFKSAAEAAFIKKKLKIKDEFYWIGTREIKLNTYERVIPISTHFSNWLSGQPRRVSERDNCVAMDSNNGKWAVKNCLEKHPFVCELSNEPEKTVIVETGECPADNQWKDLGGSNCYLFGLSSVSWNTAMLQCFKNGAHLATFQSKEELDLVKNYIAQRPEVFRASFHIGLGKKFDGSYTWVDHSPLDFVNWEEDMVRETSMNCVQMHPKTAKWRPVDCNDMMRTYVCAMSKNKSMNAESARKVEKGAIQQEKEVVKHKLSTGAIIGITTLVLIVLAIIGGIIYRRYPTSSVKPMLLEPDGL